MAWVLLLVLAIVPRPADARTLSQLISDARTLALDGASPTRQRFSDSQITQYMNEAQQIMISAGHCLQSSTQFSLTPGVTYYSLPSNFETIERVTIGQKWLQEMSMAALDGRSRGWEASSGYPTYYFMSASSRTVVGFAPWPAASTDTDTIKIQYDIHPNDLVNGTDTPYNGVVELQDFDYAVSYYAAAMMSAIEGQQARATTYTQIFTLGSAGMTKSCNASPNYRPSASGTQ